MGRKVIQSVEYFDDLDGKPANEDEITTVKFSYGNKSYQLDLRETNLAKFEKLLNPYIDAAAVVTGGRGRPKGASTRAGGGSGRSKEELQSIRDWATNEGYEVSPRGRIKAEIIEAYDAAN